MMRDVSRDTAITEGSLDNSFSDKQGYFGVLPLRYNERRYGGQ
ncbi:hypothetical protein ACN22W_36820 [Burkholderia theae]